jgi:hypothetical protein
LKTSAENLPKLSSGRKKKLRASRRHIMHTIALPNNPRYNRHVNPKLQSKREQLELEKRLVSHGRRQRKPARVGGNKVYVKMVTTGKEDGYETS